MYKKGLHIQWSSQSYSINLVILDSIQLIHYLNLYFISLQASSVSLSSFRFAYFRYRYAGGGGRNLCFSPPPSSLESSSEITEGTWTQGHLSPTVHYHESTNTKENKPRINSTKTYINLSYDVLSKDGWIKTSSISFGS